MGFYNRWILPQVIELSMRQKDFAPFRERTAGAAHGRALEVGIGSGLNLVSYPQGIDTVYGVDPSAELLTKARQRVAKVGFPVRLLEASSEKLPLEDRNPRICRAFPMSHTWHDARLYLVRGDWGPRNGSAKARAREVRMSSNNLRNAWLGTAEQR